MKVPLDKSEGPLNPTRPGPPTSSPPLRRRHRSTPLYAARGRIFIVSTSHLFITSSQ